MWVMDWRERAWRLFRLGCIGLAWGVMIGGALIALDAIEAGSVPGILRGVVYLAGGALLAWVAHTTE